MSTAEDRLHFFKQLQLLTNKIHATHDIDDIMLEMSVELCELFSGDRLTIYALSDDKASMVSKVKTGLASFKQLKLPISAQSIAGYAALSRKLLNLLDVYDEAELKRHDPELCFQQGVDRRTGYRTQQMLVSPILADNGELLGVLQLINNHKGGPFDAMVEEGVQHLCDSIAIAFTHRHKAPARERGRFAAMIPDTALPRAQLEQAMRSASARGVDIEDVLLDDLGLKTGLVGRALADFYGVPYFMFQVDRRRPHGLLDSFNREYVVQNLWMPIEEGRNGLFVLAVDPDLLKASGAVQRIFPQSVPVYCVTTRREFGWMVNQFFGAPAPAVDAAAPETTTPPPPPLAPPAPRVMPTAAPAPAMPALPDVEQTLIANSIGQLALNAAQQGISELHIETTPCADGTIRFQVSGVIRLAKP
ncbi:MAG: GAF domain-containing protein [Pseudomonadota bacterium]